MHLHQSTASKHMRTRSFSSNVSPVVSSSSLHTRWIPKVCLPCHSDDPSTRFQLTALLAYSRNRCITECRTRKEHNVSILQLLRFLHVKPHFPVCMQEILVLESDPLAFLHLVENCTDLWIELIQALICTGWDDLGSHTGCMEKVIQKLVTHAHAARVSTDDSSAINLNGKNKCAAKTAFPIPDPRSTNFSPLYDHKINQAAACHTLGLALCMSPTKSWNTISPYVNSLACDHVKQQPTNS